MIEVAEVVEEKTISVHHEINFYLRTLEHALECTNLKRDHDMLNGNYELLQCKNKRAEMTLVEN